MTGTCPSVELLERLASGEPIDDGVIDHAQHCESCQCRLREIRANLALLPDLAILRAPASAISEPHQAIEGYEIHETIARGSQGVVYRATQKATKRDVAIKVLAGGRFATQRQRIRFEREVELAAALRHVNIVTYFDSGATVDGRRFCVMEYVNGRPLDEHLQALHAAGRPLGAEAILELFLKICSAVEYAHQRGVIHRDLKPANILIDAAGEPRVVDFGLARTLEALGRVDEPTVTRPGEFAGTFAYASPEQTMGGQTDVDVRSDVYSLGVILFEMLTATLPYNTDGPLSGVIKAICEQPPRSPRSLRADVDHEVETILFKTLAKTPERRYQSVGALMRDIEHHIAGEPIDAKRDSRWYVLRKTIHRHRFAASVALLGVVMLAAFSIAMSLAYRRASSAEAIAGARSAELADSLSRSNIERGRVLSASGNVALAEETLWKEHLSPSNHDSDLAPTRWALRELYSRNPCLFEVALPPEAANDNAWAISPDSSLVLVGYPDSKRAEIYRTHTGELVSRLELAGQAPVRGCTFTGDNQRVVVGLSDQTFGTFDVRSGAIMQRSRRLDALTRRIVTSDGADRVAVCLDTGRVLLDQLSSPGSPGELITRAVEARSLRFDSSGKRLAIGFADGVVELWSVDKRALLSQARTSRSTVVGLGVNSLTFSPDDRLLISAGDSGDAEVWNVADFSAPMAPSDDVDAIAIAISPDGTWFASGGNDRIVRLRNLQTGERRIFAGHTGPVRLISFNADGPFVTSIAKDGIVRRWELQPNLLRTPRHSHSILCADANEELNLLVTGSADHSVLVTNLSGGSAQRFDTGAIVHAVALSRDGTIAAGDRAGNLHLWTLGAASATGERQVRSATTRPVHDMAINAVSFSPEGRVLATAGQDGKLQLHDVVDERVPPRQLSIGADLFSSLAFSPDGSLLAGGGKRSHAVRLWDVKSGQERAPLVGHTDIVRCVEFSRDGKLLASGADDQSIRIWNVADGKCVAVLKGQQRSVYSICFRADGKLLASVGVGGDVRIWSLVEMRLLASYSPGDETLLGLWLSSDGSRLWIWGTGPNLYELDLTRADRYIEGNRTNWEKKLAK